MPLPIMDVSKAASSKGEERLKRKLKLQEMRCELLNTEMSRLKTLIANKDKELKEAERKRKQAENRRKSEESKRKKDRKEIQKIKKESEKRFKLIEGFKKELARVNEGNTEPQSDESKVEQSSKLSVDNTCTNKENGAEVNQVSSSSTMMEVEAAEGSSPSSNGFVSPRTGADSVNDGASCSSSVPNDPRLETLFESDLMCSICHEIFIKPVVLSACSHVFCAFCIDEWRRNHHNCPICRDLILASLPEQVLENVIEKVVSSMSGESIIHRKNLIEDRKKRMEENPTSDRSDWRSDDHLGLSFFNSNSSTDSTPYGDDTFGGSESSHSLYEDDRDYDSSNSVGDNEMMFDFGDHYGYRDDSDFDAFEDEEEEDVDEDDIDEDSSHSGMRDGLPEFPNSQSDESDESETSEDSDDDNASSEHITISDDEEDEDSSDFDYSSSSSSFRLIGRNQRHYSPSWSDSSSDYSN